MPEKRVYSIDPRARDSMALFAHPWRKNMNNILFCPDCHTTPAPLLREPLKVEVLQIPKGCSYAGFLLGQFVVVRLDLVDFLLPYCSDAVLGTCYWPKRGGEEETNYRLLVQYNRVRKRGFGEHVTYYTCKVCGAVLDGGGIDSYFLHDEVDGRHVFQDVIGSVFISEHLAARFDHKRFKDLQLDPIAVLNEPAPGDPLDEILENQAKRTNRMQ